MENIYYCSHCKKYFETPKKIRHNEYGEFWGTPYAEEMVETYCPHCNSQDFREVDIESLAESILEEEELETTKDNLEIAEKELEKMGLLVQLGINSKNEIFVEYLEIKRG